MSNTTRSRGCFSKARWHFVIAAAVSTLQLLSLTAWGQLQEVEITFLANEGFLCTAADQSFVIDAFVKEDAYGYGALPTNDYEDLIGGRPPFDQIQVALTSHVHLDHFQPETATKFLAANPQCQFIASEEVAVMLRSKLGPARVLNQITSVLPATGKIDALEPKGLKISVFRLPHAGARNNTIQNLGFLVELGGVRILHVGDAEARAANFAPLKLVDRKIDLAILPVWMFDDRQMINRQITAAKYIAAHIPTKDIGKVKQKLSNQVDVYVFAKPMETWVFDPR